MKERTKRWCLRGYKGKLLSPYKRPTPLPPCTLKHQNQEPIIYPRLLPKHIRLHVLPDVSPRL